MIGQTGSKPIVNLQLEPFDQIGAGDKTNINNDGKASVSAHTGLVGRINYAFASKYLAEFSFRYDGSYKLHQENVGAFSLQDL